MVLAALLNAMKVTGRKLADLRAVVSGAGAAGMAVTKMLVEAGIGEIAVADSKGIIHLSRDDLTDSKFELAELTNQSDITGPIERAPIGADVFIGVSAGTVPEAAVASMAPGAIVFALANPHPEVGPGDGAQVRRSYCHGPVGLPPTRSTTQVGLPRDLPRCHERPHRASPTGCNWLRLTHSQMQSETASPATTSFRRPSTNGLLSTSHTQSQMRLGRMA